MGVHVLEQGQLTSGYPAEQNGLSFPNNWSLSAVPKEPFPHPWWNAHGPSLCSRSCADSHGCGEFMSAAVGPWPEEICSTFLHPAALTFFLPPLQGCYLSPGAGNTTLPLRAELPIVIDSLHFGQVLVSALITACGRKKSLWWRLSVPLIHGDKYVCWKGHLTMWLSHLAKQQQYIPGWGLWSPQPRALWLSSQKKAWIPSHGARLRSNQQVAGSHCDTPPMAPLYRRTSYSMPLFAKN